MVRNLPQTLVSTPPLSLSLSSSPAERAFEAGNDSSIPKDERENSFFVAALREHLQQGSLKDRLDNVNLLTDAAQGIIS